LTANFTPVTYQVTPIAGSGGSINASTPQTVPYDKQATFTVTPATGYGISSVTGCGGSLSGNTYTTGLITASCTVTASFTPLTYQVTPIAGTGGSLSPSTPQTVTYKAKETFNVTTSPGYNIASVTGCGGSLSGNTYTTGPITASCTVTASFTAINYTVTPIAGSGGTISPGTPQTETYGKQAIFAVNASTGYNISTVTGCSGTLTGNTYTTGQITSNCEVVASFVPQPTPPCTLTLTTVLSDPTYQIVPLTAYINPMVKCTIPNAWKITNYNWLLDGKPMNQGVSY